VTFLFIETMANSINLALEENEFQAFGINTILKDYQLCSLINEFYSIETRLLNTEALAIEISVFGDIIDDLKVLLVQNQCTNRKNIFTKLNAFEYVVIVSSSEQEISDIVKSLENNDDVLYISKVDAKYLGVKDNKLISQLFNLI
jgi:hypothetical protein